MSQTQIWQRKAGDRNLSYDSTLYVTSMSELSEHVQSVMAYSHGRHVALIGNRLPES